MKYSIEECKERDATYAAPLKVKVRLYNKEKEEISEHEIFMGDLPIDDRDRYLRNQRCRTCYRQPVSSFSWYLLWNWIMIRSVKRLFSCTVIPNRGAWLEYETDSNDIFYVRVDRTRKVPITVLIRALGIGTNAEIMELFGDEPKIEASFGKDVADELSGGSFRVIQEDPSG